MINPYVGIGSLYRANNPAERRVLTASKVAENAGLAKPLIYATMGADMAEAEQFDKDQQSTIMSALTENTKLQRQQLEMESANKVLTSIIKISEQDPEEATQVLQIAAKQYPGLAMYAGVKFTAKTKDDWMHVQGGDGQQYAISKTGLAWMAEHQDQVTDEIKGKYIVPIGLPKENEPRTEFQSYRKGMIERGETDEATIAQGWKRYQKEIQAAGRGDSTAKEDMRDYRKIESDINVLRNRRISITERQGMSALDEQSKKALQEIDDAIGEKEYYLKTEHPDIWKKRTAGRQSKAAASQPTYGDLWKEVTAAGSSSAGVKMLMDRGYSEKQAKEIVSQGLAAGKIK